MTRLYEEANDIVIRFFEFAVTNTDRYLISKSS